jgi:hypothetical protein
VTEEKKLNEAETKAEQAAEEKGKPAEPPVPSGSQAHPVQTTMLSLPDDALPMEQRDPRPNTAHLSLGWRIVFKIGDQKKTLPMKELILIGRAVESDSHANQINLDLTAFGAYHFGVSRNHAQMSLKDGYLYLEDLDSTNGTRINGFQLTANQKYRLRDGDEIEFARLRTVIQFKGPDTP